MRSQSSTSRSRVLSRVSNTIDLGAGLARVDLEGPGVGCHVVPGNFAMVSAPGRPDAILPRPYSYFLAPDDDHVALLIKQVGKGSGALAQAAVGTQVSILGPLGNAFPQPRSGETVWVVAGGVGAAPFGAMCGAPGMRIFLGARTAAEHGFARAMAEAGARISLATDDGSEGYHGTAVDLLSDELKSAGTAGKPAAIYTCGPTPMMAALAAVAERAELPCWVSLEERMACGIGICRGCAHPTTEGGWECICVKGPVYPAKQIFRATGP